MLYRIENIVKGLVVLLAFMVAQTVSDCNVCQSNKVACINSTSFYLCFGDGTPHRDQLYHCLEGFDCTNLTAICVQKSSQRPPSCGDTSQCGQCNANQNYLFACQSRGIFQMCYGATRPTGKFGYCPTGTVCDATSTAICVPEVEGQTLTCDINDALVDTTTAFPVTTESSSTDSTVNTSPETTTVITPFTPTQMCAQRNATGLFPVSPEDPYCQRYISCYFKNNILISSAEYNCPTDSYFVSQTQSCDYANPGYCL
ncbi:uncharacterized protein LOC128258757 isoform X2 [Drosophila gunungcola]|uniref:uncharacterized protein LOC128258757 isoform X2 n=1 Tax=Drosophila gunungcola TaxID=103775 RepID=UPI0022E539C5|nr:uncharacterized protein LOC128258757 isoform X2 [Drosophila gunungcola]